MARLTGTFHFKPLLSRPKPPPLLSLSSFNSKPLLLRLSKSNVLTSHSRCSAQYGGGGGGVSSRSAYSDPRESDEPDYDGGEERDLSNLSSDTVRLIDERQNMVGVVSKSEAIKMAEDAELDLVILSPDADPPVVKIIDYNKYKYNQQKKKRDQLKKTVAGRMVLKELKMGYNIEVHDYSVRLKAAQKFLKDGDKVKIIVNLKGRENEFRNKAIELIKRFQYDLGELATVESKNFLERNIFMVLVPKRTVLQKAQDPPKKKEQSAINEVQSAINEVQSAVNEVSAGV